MMQFHNGFLGLLQGVSFAEVNDFFNFIYHIDKVDLALHFYKLAGKSLSKELIQASRKVLEPPVFFHLPSFLQRVARKITGVELSDTVVNVVVALFDENGVSACMGH